MRSLADIELDLEGTERELKRLMELRLPLEDTVERNTLSAQVTQLKKEWEELKEERKQAQMLESRAHHPSGSPLYEAEFNPLEQGVNKMSEDNEQREVLVRVQQLFNVLDTLNTSINILGERLQPILNPRIYQEEAGEDPVSGDNEQSPVARELYALIDRINTQERLVRNLIRNLEI